ncbi:MAG: hypothetical protein AB1716_01210 [Planctomycetota bacterium]
MSCSVLRAPHTRQVCLAWAGVLLLACLAALSGCAGKTMRVDPDREDDTFFGAIGSKDFRAICFDMAQSLIQIPQIQNAANPPTVAFVEVTNKSDELFDPDDLLYKTRTELMKNCGGKLVFLDRDSAMMRQILEERRRKQAGVVTGDPELPALTGVNYYLTGRVETIRQTRGREGTNYLRFSFRLTNADNAQLAWEDDYDVKKYMKRGVYDR